MAMAQHTILATFFTVHMHQMARARTIFASAMLATHAAAFARAILTFAILADHATLTWWAFALTFFALAVFAFFFAFAVTLFAFASFALLVAFAVTFFAITGFAMQMAMALTFWAVEVATHVVILMAVDSQVGQM